MKQGTNKQTKQTPWPESRSEHRFLAKLVPTFTLLRSQRGGSFTATFSVF
jgi:hypothetical protein